MLTSPSPEEHEGVKENVSVDIAAEAGEKVEPLPAGFVLSESCAKEAVAIQCNSNQFANDYDASYDAQQQELAPVAPYDA